MRHQNSVLHQILQHIPWTRFDVLVDHHDADRRVRTLPSKSQFIALLMAQLSGSTSLREITSSLKSHEARLYHAGGRAPARSTLGDANAKRSPELFADLFSEVLKQATPELRRHAREAIYVLDASSIRLGNQSYSWAYREDGVAMVKMHVRYHLSHEIPVQFEVTSARVNDITVAKQQTLEPGATYVFDLGYYDFTWFSEMHAAGCRFVTRIKTHTRPRVIKEVAVAGEDNIMADRHIAIEGRLKSARERHHPLRAITLREVDIIIETGKKLRLLTNDLTSSAREIADLYKARWRIELFFKWVKQHLKIKRFIGASENAVSIQIAVALIAYVLLQIAAKAVSKTPSLLTFARLVRANLWHMRPIANLDKPPIPQPLHPGQQEFALC